METPWLESDSRSRDSEVEKEEDENEEGGTCEMEEQSHGKKSWTKVRLMVEKCKLSGNPRREGEDEGARRGHAVASPVGG